MASADEELKVSRRRVVIALSTVVPLMVCSPLIASSAAVDDSVTRLVVDELVAANRILDNQGILDAFGHVSCRHPTRQDHFLLSRSRAAGLVEADDIMEFDRAGVSVEPHGRSPYVERFIHAAIYAARPDVRAVVHGHGRQLVSFSVVKTPLRPIANNGGTFGNAISVWDIRDKFGDGTVNLVTNLETGQDLAAKLGHDAAILMRGHGAVVAGPSIRLTVALAINLSSAAAIELDAVQLGGPVTYLSSAEIEKTSKLLDPNAPGAGMDRAWEYWCRRANVPFVERGF